MPSTPSFLSYVPVELAFGTSGMRGLVADLTDLEAYISVKGAIAYLRRVGDIDAGTTVVLGGDLRPSTDRILRACMQAILDGGEAIEYAGKLPTPALVLHGLAQKRAGVMVTGSHIPFDRNGIKVSRSVGELLKSDEPGVLSEIARVRAEEYGKSADRSAFDAHGMLKRAPTLPEEDRAAQERYVRRYLDVFPAQLLRGLRIAFYQHSAVGRDLVPEILRGLGAEVIPVERSDTFVPIDTEAISETQLAQLHQIAARIDGPLDAIVSTDGDSDRPLMAAVSGEERRVRFLPGDLLGLVVAEWLRADAVAVPISSNDAIDARLAERGIALRKTRIGSPYVIAALAALQQEGAGRVVGWEANGGFLTGSALELPGGRLAALPTRDAVLPMVVNFAAAAALGLSLSALWDRLPARFGRAGLLDDLPVQASRKILAGLAAEPATTIPRFFPPALGFGELTSIDVLDGLRMYFDNGDIAHLRASGNAPQLRIYANASSQSRADQIVADGLAEPNGILRRLERAFT